MSDWLESLVETYGTIAVFMGTALEGEAVAIAGGVMAHREHLSFWPVALAAAAGGYLSDIVIYGTARRYKDAPRLSSVLENPRVASLVGRLSVNMVLFALAFRFIPGMRTAGPVALATLGMQPFQYGLLTVLSSLAWGVTSVMLGYFMGHCIEAIFGEFDRIEHALIAPAIVAVLLGGAIFIWRRQKRKNQDS